jgi:peroxiredoxin Q/BCP
LPKQTRVTVGSKAPDFTLRDQEGRLVRLSDFRGRKVIIYFYVRDDTPGCTRQACSFRDGIEKVEERKAIVLGVSPDPVESHKRFVERYHLPFPLLSDEDAELAKKFGVWGKKNMYGRTFHGIIRSTFIINEEGLVEKEFRRVKADGHFDRILKEI